MTDEDLRIRRVAERAAYDRQTVADIVDAALIAHVGTVRDGKLTFTTGRQFVTLIVNDSGGGPSNARRAAQPAAL